MFAGKAPSPLALNVRVMAKLLTAMSTYHETTTACIGEFMYYLTVF